MVPIEFPRWWHVFAIPSIIAMLVSAVYNIADQLFIGNAVGTLGNAATNIAFPLSMLCTSLALLFGIGGAASFNLHMGAGRKEEAPYYIGNSITMLLSLGFLLLLITELFLNPLLVLFGSPADVLPLAEQYVRVTAVGFPFLILTIGSGHLIRADGNPKMAMFVTVSGAVINIVLDALFVFGFQWGMYGAAWATVIGQIISAAIAIRYLMHYRTVTLENQHFIPSGKVLAQICSLGMSSGINQIAMMIVQIVMNNTLAHYGALSVYGSDIPLACAGIISKVNMIFMSFVIGISQGVQPIIGFNYGAALYRRVKKSYLLALAVATGLSLAAFACFQLFPRQIISIFGTGSEMYYQFSERYFRIYMFLTLINGIQPVTSNFFNSIGKARLGVFMSLTRQILFLLPLIVIFPLFMGIDGVMYAGPIADGAAAIVCGLFTVRELRELTRLQQKTEKTN